MRIIAGQTEKTRALQPIASTARCRFNTAASCRPRVCPGATAIRLCPCPAERAAAGPLRPPARGRRPARLRRLRRGPRAPWQRPAQGREGPCALWAWLGLRRRAGPAAWRPSLRGVDGRGRRPCLLQQASPLQAPRCSGPLPWQCCRKPQRGICLGDGHDGGQALAE